MVGIDPNVNGKYDRELMIVLSIGSRRDNMIAGSSTRELEKECQ